MANDAGPSAPTTTASDLTSESLAALRRALYHTECSGTPDARLHHVRSALGLPDLDHGGIGSLSNEQARLAVAEIDRTFGPRRRGLPRGSSRRTRTRLSL